MSLRDQFDLNLTTEENNLQKAMKEGKFILLFEVDTPPSDCNIETAVSRFKPILKALEPLEEFKAGLAISNKRYSGSSMDILDFASELCANNRSDHLLIISGRDKTKREAADLLKSSIAKGFYNVVPVSGAAFKGETSKTLNSSGFFESVEAMRFLKSEFSENRKLNIGSVVNPFKYSQESSHTQYFKLIKKFNSGAGFTISQAGWDIMKNQELRWYLENRNYFDPCLASIILLSPERIEKIVSGYYGGVFFSTDFLSILNRESRLSVSQFWAAQWRRFQLQVAGLRWMGYSGVVISGLENEYYVNTAVSRIISALKDINSFEKWREIYRSFISRNEMAPYPYKYYLYKNLLEENFFDKAETTVTNLKSCQFSERFSYKLGKMKNMFFPGGTKTSLNGAIPESFYISSQSCPKTMAHGPCGETMHDNSCCLKPSKECVYSKLFRLASWQKKFDLFEQHLVEEF